MKDSIEGNLSNPINMRFRIKCGMTGRGCANDPINKIDPAGTTPQNTGLPPRYENEPQAVKWAGSNRTAFCTPPIANPSNLSNGPIGPIESGQEPTMKLWTPENGYGNDVWGNPDDAMGTFDACNRRSPFDKMVKGYGFEIIEIDGVKYIVAYGKDQNGNPITTVRTLDGKETPESIAIETAINQALWKIACDTDYFVDPNTKVQNLSNLIKGLKDFTGKNLNDFKRIVYGGTLGTTGLKDFFYHATKGYAIGYYLAHDPDYEGRDPEKDNRMASKENFNKYDHEIGFWTSFYNSHLGLGMSFWGDATHPGLVDFGNVIKSMIMQESSFQQSVNGSPYGHDLVNGNYTRWGLMAVGFYKESSIEYSANKILRGINPSAKGFNLHDIQYSTFSNIGAGIGHLLDTMSHHLGGSVLKAGFTFQQLFECVQAYNSWEFTFSNDPNNPNYRRYSYEVYIRFRGYQKESNKHSPYP